MLEETTSISTTSRSLTEISEISHYNSQSDSSGNNAHSKSIVNVVTLVDYDETLNKDHDSNSSNNTFNNSMHIADANNKVILNTFSEPLDLNKSITVMNSTRTYESFDNQLHGYRVRIRNKFTYEKQHSSKKSIHTLRDVKYV